MHIVMSKVTRRYKVGYEIREETYMIPPTNEPITFYSAYTKDGHYIGSTKLAHRLLVKRGIKPELARPKKTICTIGFCEKEQKWYGWSHRGMCGFGIGDVVQEGDIIAYDPMYNLLVTGLDEADDSYPIDTVALTLDDCKKMAIVFADSVS